MAAPAVGIDLGTTYSCVAVFRNGKVEVIPNAEGSRITPSYVAFTNTKRLIGEDAKAQAELNPENTVYDVKRLIGRRFDDPIVQADIKLLPFTVVNKNGKLKIQVQFKGKRKKFYPEEISAIVLSKLKSSAEDYLGMKVYTAVVTVPAYFNDSQRQATRDAGTIAGLKVLRIINEPTAGAIAYGFGNTEEKKNVLIFDLGGGTFDVSVLTIEQGVFEVHASVGHTNLGGEDFDSRLLEHFANEFTRKHRLDLRGDKKALRRLRTACERAKRSLSSEMQTSVDLPALYGGKDLQEVITRTRFEELNSDLFIKTQDIMQRAMLEAKMGKDVITEVVLIGGSTRIPYIQQMIRAFFEKEPSKTTWPDEAVARGAAIQAAILDGVPFDTISDVVLVDVVPLSLGIKVFGDIMNVIIKRNTTIPTKHTERYRTAVDDQTKIPIMVYEGESLKTAENNLLGEFEISGVPPLPVGQAKVDVTFAINADGILHVSAVQTLTQDKKEITIITNKGRLTQEEISRLGREAEAMKQDDEGRGGRGEEQAGKHQPARIAVRTEQEALHQ